MDKKKGKGAGDKLKTLKKYIQEKNIIQGLRYLILALLAALCCVIAFASVERGNGAPVIITLASAVALVFSMVMKIFVMRTFMRKIAWYVFDSLLLLVFTVFSSWNISLVFGSSYAYLVYMLVLSEYYLSAPALRDDIIMFAVNAAAYTVVYAVNAAVNNDFGSAFLISSQYFLVLIVLVLHFVMFNFAMTVSRKNKQIEENLREIEESRNELQRAYDKLEEATVIEERNRIAKEIHDTAGHSLTTVIMQTEAARLAMDKDPARARHCIDAANLQAKNCLEELRLSVHLLSGRRENVTLKEYLEGILEETANGTSFTVRSKIDDVEMTEAAERFISNTLREGISNGIRHGRSTAFFFELKDMGNYVELLLSDNGSGTDMHTFKEGFGLSSMRAKAEKFGGMVQFSSEPGEGFEIRLSLPGKWKKTKSSDL
ncbi:MAG TPA: sensor histidine kinase [Candidatus Borkfalkia excrementigallinarum]|uniref:Oxygen sensor histidine kinase NreB n=1 Tax=Candidatus Borkfalkia excrementigallinarum TaxID=2838506 RepID=A0A9D2CRT0_9FIRM|nr:sensor histidine kinase [Candidatus Borkfalkia excrementigallinarum]